MSQEEQLSEEEYLRRHIESVEREKQFTSQKEAVAPEVDQSFGMAPDSARVGELQYFSIDTRELPCGVFYPKGSYIQIRAAKVIEIQYFSMVDDNNIYDILEKINYILSSCLKLKYSTGETKTYLDLKDPDKFFVIFLIRELTFQKGNYLTTKATCSVDGTECNIELKRANFEFHTPNEKIKNFYNQNLNCYSFETVNDYIFNLSPPTVGIQKSLYEWVQQRNAEGKKVNPSFLKIMPYLAHGQNSLDNQRLLELEKDFSDEEKMDDISFQFLNNTVDLMKFGIKCVKSTCSCGQEVRSESIFPRGASSLFVIRDAFDRYIKK
jgi:hypothetical protein